MKVSIAMASYNGAKYLREQLESFLSQSRLPDELIVCDDGSSDSTIATLSEFSELSLFDVHIYKNDENIGFLKNFEKALLNCTGDFIFFSDQDDVWFSNKIERVLSEFDRDQNVMVVCNDQTITDENLNHSNNTMLSNTRRLGYPDSWHVTGCCTCVKKEFVELVVPIPEKIGAHDVWINGLADILGVRRILPESLQFYRRYGTNVSTSEAQSLGKTSRLANMWSYGIKNLANEWNAVRVQKLIYHERISSRRELLASWVGESVVFEALFKLEKFSESIAKRAQICSLPRAQRPLKILRFMSRGGYRDFNGWQSAIKDQIMVNP